MSENPPTHADLVERAARWLEATRRCCFVVTEPRPQVMPEQPDAIGWTPWGLSIVVECKTTENDFAGDSRKPFRRSPWLGVGQLRYYLAPPAVIRPQKLRSGWGLLEVRGRRIVVVVEARERKGPGEFNANMERRLLLSLLRAATDYKARPGLRSES